jgi:hypothetical protein
MSFSQPTPNRKPAPDGEVERRPGPGARLRRIHLSAGRGGRHRAQEIFWMIAISSSGG